MNTNSTPNITIPAGLLNTPKWALLETVIRAEITGDYEEMDSAELETSWCYSLDEEAQNRATSRLLYAHGIYLRAITLHYPSGEQLPIYAHQVIDTTDPEMRCALHALTLAGLLSQPEEGIYSVPEGAAALLGGSAARE